MPFDNTTYPETETQTDRDLHILRAAREGISKPGGWCQDAYHRGYSHCAVGWIAEMTGNLKTADLEALRLLGSDLPKSFASVVSYNDNRTKNSVIRLFSRAIARLERERDAK